MCGYVERDCSPDRVKFDLVEGVTEGGDIGVPVLIEIITTQFLNPHILYQSHNSFGLCSPLLSPIRMPHNAYVSRSESPKNGESPVRRTYVTTPTDLPTNNVQDKHHEHQQIRYVGLLAKGH